MPSKRPTAYCDCCESTVYADDVHSCYDAKCARAVEDARDKVVEAAEEKTLALEVATLRRIIGHGTAAHDSRTLRNIQEQRNKIVAAVLRMIDHDDDWGYVRADILDAAREFRRITGGEP